MPPATPALAMPRLISAAAERPPVSFTSGTSGPEPSEAAVSLMKKPSNSVSGLAKLLSKNSRRPWVS